MVSCTVSISPYKITFPQTSISNNPYIYQNGTSKWNQPTSIFETLNQSSVLRLYDIANSNDSGFYYHFASNTTNWLTGSVSGTVYANQTGQSFGIANDNPDYNAVVNDVLGTTVTTGSVGG